MKQVKGEMGILTAVQLPTQANCLPRTGFKLRGVSSSLCYSPSSPTLTQTLGPFEQTRARAQATFSRPSYSNSRSVRHKSVGFYND